MEDLKIMKKNLMAAVQSQMGNLQNVDTKELGEAIDMIKDLSEATYYCSVVEAMECSKKEKEEMEKMMAKGYTQVPHMYYPPYKEDYYYDGGTRGYNASARGNNARGGGTRGYEEEEYYDGGSRGYSSRSSRGYGSRMYTEGEMHPIMSSTGMRDYREGRSGISRRGYMESKEMHMGKEKKLQELEKYMNELAQDITEMISDAEPEEKQKLSEKLTHLAEKVK